VPLLGSPEDAPLRGAVLGWLDQVLIPRRGEGQEIPETLELEEFRTMLEKRVEEWNRILREEGRQEGRQEGLQEGLQKGLQKGEATLLLSLLEQKFGRLDSKTRRRVQSAGAERLLDWGARVLTAERLEDVFN
jgi:flagellar biosynthesis/type III secretory pathway protein FliH